MSEMYKYTKEVDITYFKKIKTTIIENVNEGEIIYIKVYSPLNYGIKEWEYYGRLIKKTNHFFDILEYFGNSRMNYWSTDEIEKKEENQKKYTKKWAKKSIIQICTVKTENKKELKEFETNNMNNIKIVE